MVLFMFLNILLMATRPQKMDEGREINGWGLLVDMRIRGRVKSSTVKRKTGEEMINLRDFKDRINRIWCWTG